MQVSGSGVIGYDGTYTGIGLFQGVPSWRLANEEHYLWHAAVSDEWYLNEWRGEEEDADNLGYQRDVANGPTGTYSWFEVVCTASNGAPDPDIEGSFFYRGMLAGRPYFYFGEDDFFAWYNAGTDKYRLTVEPETGDGPGDEWWEADNTGTVYSDYTAQGTATNDVDIDPGANDIATVTKL